MTTESRRLLPGLLGLILILAAPTWASEPNGAGTAAPDARAAFESLKGLEGEWHGTTRRGNAATLRYQVIAGGHSVLEEFRETMGEREISMHTVYHLDGEELMLTHYCISNNQPRMRADLAGLPDLLRFEFMDATNLAAPGDGHMRRAVIELKADDRIVNAWTYRKDGEDQYTETIDWRRRK